MTISLTDQVGLLLRPAFGDPLESVVDSEDCPVRPDGTPQGVIHARQVTHDYCQPMQWRKCPVTSARKVPADAKAVNE
jgi:hypothetical protein